MCTGKNTNAALNVVRGKTHLVTPTAHCPAGRGTRRRGL